MSRWHRVRSDEVWHYDEGAALELLLVAPDECRLERCRLGPLGPAQAPARLPQPSPELEPAVRAYLLAVLAAVEAEE